MERTEFSTAKQNRNVIHILIFYYNLVCDVDDINDLGYI